MIRKRCKATAWLANVSEHLVEPRMLFNTFDGKHSEYNVVVEFVGSWVYKANVVLYDFGSAVSKKRCRWLGL